MEGSKEVLPARVPVDRLHGFCVDALVSSGLRHHDAATTADVLVTTDTWGVFTHGTNNLRGYVRKVKAGGIDPQAVVEVVTEGVAGALMDGHAAIGMVTASQAMELAIRKAKASGIGYVGVKAGTHFGAAGYYASMALKADFIGLAMSNTDPNMSVSGGRGRILGNNPFAFAAPAGAEQPVLLDIAMSTIAGAKMWRIQAEGKSIPDNWLTDADGLPTTDVTVWPHPGALSPFGGHKGYALALMVEILSSVCTGAGIMREVPTWTENSAHNNAGHFFIAINPGTLMPISAFKQRMDQAIRELKDSPKAKGSERVYVPGEMEWEKRDEALKHGILFPELVFKNLLGLAEDVGLDFQKVIEPAGK
jgi:ureidoglycolate dehydrogenase (NAD+)